MSQDSSKNVVVIGAGPGGYVAAIRAADLGLDVAVVESRPDLGGVCLLEGCIPSKALISAVELAETAKAAGQMGLTFDNLRIDSAALREYTQSVVTGLSQGVGGLLKKRGVSVVHGRARFVGPNELAIEGEEERSLRFEHCIIATGSRPVSMPGPSVEGLWTSTEALALSEVPERLLVVGGGYIGLELGLVYAGLGSKVTCAELLPQLLTGADRDLVKVVQRHCEKRFEAVRLETRVEKIEGREGGYAVEFVRGEEREEASFDRILASIGRRPNTEALGLEDAGVEVGERGVIAVNERQQTNVAHIYAIGDITPGPGLAHKASREGKVAAEVIAGEMAAFDNVAIPAIVFTDPELAWVGLTETEAQEAGRKVKIGRFPLSALGRARTIGRTDGLAKIIADPETDRVLGVGIVAPHASELIGEATLALEMGATVEDVAVTIHPHPTLSESLCEAAEVAQGMAVHIYQPRGR